MDLVEIRKKARKKQKSASQPSRGGSPQQERKRAVSSGERDVADRADGKDNSAAAGNQRVPVAETELSGGEAFTQKTKAAGNEEKATSAAPDGAPGHDDFLDRLFTGQGELALATEEMYLKALQADKEKDEGQRRRWLTFAIGQEHYALDIEQVREIIKPRELTEIPRAPDFLPGIISLRGVIVPIVDLARRLRLGETGLSERTRIIVCEFGDRIAGLLVDNIAQVVDVAEHQIEPPPAVLTGLDRDMVEGVGRVQGRMIVLLNVEQVLDLESATA